MISRRQALAIAASHLLLVLAALLLLSLSGCGWALHTTPDGDVHLTSAASSLGVAAFLTALLVIAIIAMERS